MKKWCAFLAMYFLLCSLAACSGTAEREDSSQEPDADLQAAAVMTCRVVDGAGTNTLLLAGESDAAHDIYAVPLAGLSVSGARNGDLVQVGYSGSILETFPAQLGDVSGLTVQQDGFDDRCVLYLQVLEDLWNNDTELNADIAQIGVDLSQTSLTGSEQSAVAWAFGQRHGLEVIQGTSAELQAQGYFTGIEGWTDGCLFSIAEQSRAQTGTVTFDAEKWRSGDGAYFFRNCTAQQSQDGHWSGYEVGTYAIA